MPRNPPLPPTVPTTREKHSYEAHDPHDRGGRGRGARPRRLRRQQQPDRPRGRWWRQHGLGGGSGSITVGSADFSESQVLGEIYAGAIKAKGIKVTTKPNIGSRDVYIKALQDGSIDIVPEYTGSLLTFLKGTAPSQDPDAVYTALKTTLPPTLVVLDKSAAEDKNSIVVTKDTRDQVLAEVDRRPHRAPGRHHRRRAAGVPDRVSRAGRAEVRVRLHAGELPAAQGCGDRQRADQRPGAGGQHLQHRPVDLGQRVRHAGGPEALFGSDNVVPLIAQGQGQRHHHRRAQRGLGQDRHGDVDRPGQAGRRRQEGRVGRGQGLPVEERPGLTEGVSQPWILHVDLDQFVAAVEVLRDPSLVGKPVVVGGRGDPTLRGVVSTASYEARVFGVGSGMPLRTAVKKAPDAVFLPVDGPLYDEASAGVMAVLRSFGPTDGAVVEVLGWDEAFVGVATDDPEALARRMQAAVLAQTRLHCSVGIGQTKVMAKTATGFGKPQGVYTITADTWYEIMGPRPTEALWGVGRKTSAKLAALGIETVSQLALSDAELLVTRLGPTMGPWYRRIARGGDRSPGRRRRPGWPAATAGRRRSRRTCATGTVVAQEVRTLAARVLDDIVGRGPAGDPRGPQGPVRAVHHAYGLGSAAVPDRRPRTRSPTRRSRC